jgi:hypothetical protein
VKRESERALVQSSLPKNMQRKRLCDFVFPAEKTQKRGRAHAKLLVKKT